MRLKKQHITFAWGPRGGASVASRRSSSRSRRDRWQGSVARLMRRRSRPLGPVRPYTGTPVASASSATAAHPAALGADGKAATLWVRAEARARRRLSTSAPRASTAARLLIGRPEWRRRITWSRHWPMARSGTAPTRSLEGTAVATGFSARDGVAVFAPANPVVAGCPVHTDSAASVLPVELSNAERVCRARRRERAGGELSEISERQAVVLDRGGRGARRFGSADQRAGGNRAARGQFLSRALSARRRKAGDAGTTRSRPSRSRTVSADPVGDVDGGRAEARYHDVHLEHV